MRPRPASKSPRSSRRPRTFANVQLFSAYDYYDHLRLKPLPVTDRCGVTLQFDLQVLPVNGEEGNVRPDCVKYPSVGWDKLTITSGSGDICEVPLTAYRSVLSEFTPDSFQIALKDKKAEDLDALVGGTTPAITDAAYVYFMGTRWSCTPAEAIAFCNLVTRLLNNIGAVDAPSCEQSIWWQDNPNFYHYLLVNGGGAGIPEAGVNGPVRVSTNSGSAPATLTRFVPGIYTAQVSSSAEIRAALPPGNVRRRPFLPHLRTETRNWLTARRGLSDHSQDARKQRRDGRDYP